MSNSLETVKKAIEFGKPDYIPCYDMHTDNPDTDVVNICYTWRPGPGDMSAYTTEWGFVVRPNPYVSGYHIDYNPLADWRDYGRYAFPDVEKIAKPIIEKTHADLLGQNSRQFQGKYVLGHMTAGPYLIVGMIRGEENFFTDLLTEKARIYELFGRVMDYQIEIFKQFARLGAHGVLIHEDWGSSHGLIMSPDSWREIFLPHYLRAKAAANAAGLHFAIQVTGNVEEVVPDLIKNKVVDMFFYPEPRAIGIEKLGSLVKGKLCLFTCMDSKITGPHGTPEEIRSEVRELVRNVWTKEGGLAFWLNIGHNNNKEKRKLAQMSQIDEYRKLRSYNECKNK